MSMDPKRRTVKRTRAYDAAGRQQRAREQHVAALDAAHRLFLERGYVATTVESIAQEAGVSVATIYKTYGGKAGLIRSLCQRGLEGAGPVPAETRSNALRAGSDPRELIAGWGRLSMEVAPRLAPLVLLLRVAAHGDAEAAALYEEIDRAKLARMADNARHLHSSGYLRAGVTARDARDVLWACSSAELYDLLVCQRGWTLATYGGFITETMVAALL